VVEAARLAATLATALLLFAAGPAGAAPEQDRRWKQLNADQHAILAPLEAEWDRQEPAQRIKWIGVAKRYPKMTPVGQQRVQSNMKKWAKLTPEQRKQARENYRRISKVPPEKRGDLKQQWDEYQALPPQQRQKPAPKKKPAKAQ
jgi:hypothetical protein